MQEEDDEDADADADVGDDDFSLSPRTKQMKEGAELHGRTKLQPSKTDKSRVSDYCFYYISLHRPITPFFQHNTLL